MRLNYSELVHSLPHTTEFHEHITLLFELIKFSVEPEHYKLPSYQRLFQLVRLADYIGCDRFLQRVASRLGVAVPMVSNANPIRKVRGLIRSKYRAHSKFVEDIWTKGNRCAKCGWLLIGGTSVLQRPQLSTTPCCGADEHLGCNVLDMCRHCNTNLKVLSCVVCNNEIGGCRGRGGWDYGWEQAIHTRLLQAAHNKHTFSSCQRFSIGFASGLSGGVLHQLILCSSKNAWA